MDDWKTICKRVVGMLVVFGIVVLTLWYFLVFAQGG